MDDCSEYEDEVSDEHMVICLKVIRTVRNCCLRHDVFDADGAVILSHAHAKLKELYTLATKNEDYSDDKVADPT